MGGPTPCGSQSPQVEVEAWLCVRPPPLSPGELPRLWWTPKGQGPGLRDLVLGLKAAALPPLFLSLLKTPDSCWCSQHVDSFRRLASDMNFPASPR